MFRFVFVVAELKPADAGIVVEPYDQVLLVREKPSADGFSFNLFLWRKLFEHAGIKCCRPWYFSTLLHRITGTRPSLYPGFEIYRLGKTCLVEKLGSLG